jgi:hypothetical protein
LGVKEGDHAALFAHVAAAEHAGRVTYYDREDAETGLRHRFRFVSDMPLNEANVDLRVNFLECWEWDGDQSQHFSWVTDLRVTKGTVYQLMRGGRARWRIENETFNTLKNQGYHFEHNKYPPAKPEVLRLLAPQRGLTAIAKSKPKTEQTTNGRLPELSNFGSPPAEPGVYHD